MGGIQRPQKLKTILFASASRTATFAETLVDLQLGGYRELILTFDVTAAERDSSDETYDIWVVGSDGVSTWDIAHFPQVATTGAKRFTARVLAERLATVTTASPGVASEPSATMRTDTAGSNEGTKTLAAGTVRHGPFGDLIGVMGTVAGTIGGTGITFSIQLQAAA